MRATVTGMSFDADLGPVDVVVVRFPTLPIPASGFDLLDDRVSSGRVNVLDIEFVSRSADGAAIRLDAGTVGLETLTGADSSLIDEGGIATAATELADVEAAAIVVYEDLTFLAVIGAMGRRRRVDHHQGTCAGRRSDRRARRRRREPSMSLIRTATRAAVASSVHDRVQRRQKQRSAQQAPARPAVPQPAPVQAAESAAAAPTTALMNDLTSLRPAGVVTDAEFADISSIFG